MYTRLSYHKITKTHFSIKSFPLYQNYIYIKITQQYTHSTPYHKNITTLFRNTIFYHPKLLPRRLPLLVAL